MALSKYETVIGLEVHAQLLTSTKQFCACAIRFGEEPNSNVCPVCLGLPGALPVLNARAIEMAVRTALALHCEIRERSIFARKNYFYPDLPKGYQISQFDLPFSEHGWLEVPADPKEREGTKEGDPARIGITRAHMEEDAGKNMHGVAEAGGRSVVDLNRAGTPLLEIVSEPDLRSGNEAVAYLKKLRDILVWLGVNDGNLEEGSFRCDVNLSVRPRGQKEYGTRVELKNINSFRFVSHAIDHEVARLIALADAGKTFKQHTRQWSEPKGVTEFLREKEGSDDYRYFPDPDLPPLVLERPWIESLRAQLPELPDEKRARWVADLKLPAADADVLTSHPRITDFFEGVLAKLPADATYAKRAANFVMTEVLAVTKTHGLQAEFPANEQQVAELIALVSNNSISSRQAKEVFAAVVHSDHSPQKYVEEHKMEQVTDVTALEAICQKLIAENPKQVASFKAGKTNVMGFFVGQVMKETKNSASPALVNKILSKLLEQ